MKVLLHIVVIVMLVAVGFWAGFYYGEKAGYEKGVAVQQVIVNPIEKVTEQAEEYSNPFKYQNPFEDVKTNPYEN
ncbi:hypothetical protein HN858_04490 [Candidatus Falkowbacteria bacterium]|jgi:hypothetical protein|nr:hypothetical protein [Candidatus Falkowbacteria bacterium]MBT5503844.1 hypothetical protein [Candidatus Falkowbacteria bacterium]MBT6574387.1 hypothetical protein [Candidatus Falkowbacteria bacterium]MBT7348903.1 hypothetical protein [Candidatus Falkowbacteria bacterium]MBT7501260.1 hypothetical protein [Candidatus Falkowbacteria bacterium]